ncbi:hypothetical protein PE066_20570 [Ramlibacter tataouinensis]|nr:hypothetical protein [Ramlibacter tataouinensis]WBY01815.1 hypothetical protein PE066_20570 [Ramlibacter tataouinensis]
MFDKILIANRGARAEGAGVHSHAQHVTCAPNGLARAACAGDLAAETTHV